MDTYILTIGPSFIGSHHVTPLICALCNVACIISAARQPGQGGFADYSQLYSSKGRGCLFPVNFSCFRAVFQRGFWCALTWSQHLKPHLWGLHCLQQQYRDLHLISVLPTCSHIQLLPPASSSAPLVSTNTELVEFPNIWKSVFCHISKEYLRYKGCQPNSDWIKHIRESIGSWN